MNQNGDYIKSNQVLIAPGGRHMKLVKSGSGFMVAIEDTPPVNRHKPSVDSLFQSAHVSALRKKLKDFDHSIKSLYGSGYILRPSSRSKR